MLLLIPIPIAVGTLRSASHAGFGSLFAIPLSSEIYENRFVSASVLNHLFNQRNIDIPGVKNYGNTWLYYPSNNSGSEYEEYDPKKAYTIENLQPFNLGQFGDDFSVTQIKIENESQLGTVQQMSNGTQKKQKSNELEIRKKSSASSNGSQEEGRTIEEYYLSKSDFESSIFSDKGDLQLVIDLNLDFEYGQGFSPAVVDLSQFISENTADIPLISISPPTGETANASNERITFLLKVSKDSNDNLNFSLVKKRENSSGSSSEEQNSDKVNVSVRNFFLLFSDSPALPFEDMFKTADRDSSSSYTQHRENRIRRIYLGTWNNKTKNSWNSPSGSRTRRSTESSESPKFSFSNTNDFWRSLCSDVYKIGGFIDEKSQPNGAANLSASVEKNKSDTYVKQQKKFHEDFDPRKDRLVTPKDTTLQTALPHTTPAPCSGLDTATKELFKEYAKPSGAIPMVHELKTTID